jgi:uncharacterized protein YcfJ
VVSARGSACLNKLMKSSKAVRSCENVSVAVGSREGTGVSVGSGVGAVEGAVLGSTVGGAEGCGAGVVVVAKVPPLFG